LPERLLLSAMVFNDVRKFSLLQLTSWMEENGLPAYRARQVFSWIWQKGINDFNEMTDLPQNMRSILSEKFVFKPLHIHSTQLSKDGTTKCAFELFDKNIVEGVLIPSRDRTTACVSSQVGCSLNCKFCATGYLDRKRNLEAAEIVDQVRTLAALSMEHHGRGLSNIVYMGMGEPLLNYTEVMRSIDILTSPHGLGISPQRITLSTAGISKMIRRLADDNSGVQLALSLHVANDIARTQLMPINESNNLDSLADSLLYYYSKTSNRPTLEYTVIHGVNDSENDLDQLALFAKRFPSKINLIEYNPISEAHFRPSSSDSLLRFADGLRNKKLIVNVRRSRGKDIDAACGQL